MAERYHRELPDYRKAVKGAPSGKFVLALEHQPKIAARLAKQGAGLVLTGHTHGGQAPLMAEITEFWLNHGYVKGLYYVDRGYNDLRMPLYVNHGDICEWVSSKTRDVRRNYAYTPAVRQWCAGTGKEHFRKQVIKCTILLSWGRQAPLEQAHST